MRNPLVLSSIAWHEIEPKLTRQNLLTLEKALQHNIDLSTYGQLKGLALIYLAKLPDDEIHKESATYSRKKQELVILKRLPYEKIQQATEPETLHLMAKACVEAMSESLPKKKIPDFDRDAFVKDVSTLFEQKGWLQIAELSA